MLEQIKAADKAYYEQDNPIMTDIEYDQLRNEFIGKYGEQELDYVPGEIARGLQLFTDKVQATDTDKLKTLLSKLFPVCIQKKLDGLTIVIYRNKAVTRGNGTKGEIVNFFPIKYNLLNNRSEYPIRGELILTRSAFQSINNERQQQGLELYKNPRNAAAGIIRNIDKSPYVDKLIFVAYDLVDCPWTVEQKLSYISERTDFDVIDNILPQTIEDAMDIISTEYEATKDGDIPIDGMVVKSNRQNSLRQFGQTKHHPSDAFAWKAVQKGAVTTLRNIRWQVGRSQITCVAEFDTVELDGTQVSNASVSNIGIIKKLGLSIGAKILVNKANQIIPQIVQVLETGATPIYAPTHCPCCQHKLTNINNVLFCTNSECTGRLAQNINYLTSKKVLDIRGFSEATIQKLIEQNKLKRTTDIFSLTFDDFIDLNGFEKKSATKLVESIDNARNNVELANFIAACCVPNIGIDIGTKLSRRFKTYEVILDKLQSTFDFSQIEGIGEINNSLLHKQEFIQAFKELRKYIVPKKDTSIQISNSNSYTFVITGTLSQPRSYFKKLIESSGSKLSNVVNAKTNYLVCEDLHSNSVKTRKARELGVRVINEAQLIQLLKG